MGHLNNMQNPNRKLTPSKGQMGQNRANSAMANNNGATTGAATRVYEQHMNTSKAGKAKLNNRSNTIEVLVGNNGAEKESRKVAKTK